MRALNVPKQIENDIHMIYIYISLYLVLHYMEYNSFMNVCVPQCIWCPCDACVSAGPNPCALHSQNAIVPLRSSCPEHSDTTQHLLYTHTHTCINSFIRNTGIVQTDWWSCIIKCCLWVVCRLCVHTWRCWDPWRIGRCPGLRTAMEDPELWSRCYHPPSPSYCYTHTYMQFKQCATLAYTSSKATINIKWPFVKLHILSYNNFKLYRNSYRIQHEISLTSMISSKFALNYV